MPISKFVTLGTSHIMLKLKYTEGHSSLKCTKHIPDPLKIKIFMADNPLLLNDRSTKSVILVSLQTASLLVSNSQSFTVQKSEDYFTTDP